MRRAKLQLAAAALALAQSEELGQASQSQGATLGGASLGNVAV